MEEKNKIHYDVEEEMYCGVARAIPLKKVFELMKSICKIEYYLNNKKYNGTGFFMELFDIGQNVLITNFHVISERVINEKTEINLILENDKEKKIKLDKNERLIKCFKMPIDAVIIEILDSDRIKDDVVFLFHDLNIFNGYEQYKGEDIIVLQHPLGKDIHCGIGKIIDFIDFEFHHSADTDFGSSGSPIILYKNFFVIGIHKGADRVLKYNIGTFFHIIIEQIKNIDVLQNNTPLNSKYETGINRNNIINDINKNIINDINKNNIINDINRNIIINDINKNDIINDINKNNIINDINGNHFNNDINSKQIINANNQEQSKKNSNDKDKTDNNELILIYKKDFGNFRLFGSTFIDHNKNNCKLIINGKETELCEYFRDNKNTLEVKFIQTKKITDLSYMLFNSTIIEIKNILYLSSKYITNMQSMFKKCEYITSIPEEFSYFDTSNVTYMDNMFYFCTNLEKLPDISKWNTINVKDMRCMFEKCKSLKIAPDISKWNIKNVIYMQCLFSECSSLEYIPNISQIQVQEGCQIHRMFYKCNEKLHIPDKFKNN